MLQMVSFSNNMEYEEDDDAEDVKAGSFYTTPNGTNTSFSFFREDDSDYHKNYPYKQISDDEIKAVVKDCGYNPDVADTPEFTENLETTTPCNSFVTSVFDFDRFLYYIRYGMMFIDGKVPQKHIMRYPQFFATRKIIERLDNGGKGGIIWHTQGSGKTGLAAFSNRIITDYYAKKLLIPLPKVKSRRTLILKTATWTTALFKNLIEFNGRQQFVIIIAVISVASLIKAINVSE